MTEATPLPGKRFVVPALVSTNFHIRQGDVVADFGAGRGYFTKVLSDLVGREGTVYSCEIQKKLVECVGELARREGLENVSPLWCDIEASNGSKIPTDALDVALVANSLYLFEDKGAALEEIKRTLRTGGKLIVIDWCESYGGIGPHTDQVVCANDARALAEEHGYTFERSFDAGDHHYGLAFRL